MRKNLSAFTLLFLFTALQAQVNRNIPPVSSLVSSEFFTTLAQINLPPFNLQAAIELDKAEAERNEMPKFSRSIFTDITFKNSGTWTVLPNGSRVWRLQITSKDAEALLPYFKKFYLPKGSSFHVYTPDREEMIGAFTNENNPTDGYYATGLIHGETCILEYFEPLEVKDRGEICLNEIGHAYRWVENYFPKKHKAGGSPLSFNQSDVCEVNVNCSEGAAWQNEKRAVACIIVQSNFGQGSCSGTMINNVRQDCTPYLLSAQHCTEGTTTNQYSQWLFYYNFEAPTCSNPSAIGHLGDYFVTGCTKKADSNDNGGDTGSDFLLLQLTNTPPDTFHLYYAGWSAANVASDSGVCIHHPYTDMKKISTYTQATVSDTWNTVAGTHWRTRWAATTNGHGVTEEGSSGSALFNKNKQIIGTLTGGDSYCSTPNAADYFGKLSYHWVSNGTTNNLRLKPWLDPDSTGTISLNGKDAICNATGINRVEENISLRVFPNPSNEVFNLQFDETMEKSVRVFDALGKIIFEKKTNEQNFAIDLSGASKGIYILETQSSLGKAQQKLILK